MNKVKINYYDTFRCTADQCPYTCCQEWAISIDEETIKKWDGIQFDGKVLCDCLEKGDSGQVMSLNEEKKCPFLSNKGLCSMVVDLGEDYLSDICMSYPRHINKFEKREEYSLDFGCPAVIDLLHSTTEGVSFVADKGTVQSSSLRYQVRALMLEMMANTKYTLTERIMMNFYCLLDILEQEQVTKEMLDEYRSEAYLSELASEMRKVEMDKAESFWERNEFFLDIVQLYRREENYTSYLEDISVWAEKMEEYYSDLAIEEKMEKFETQYIAYEKLMKDYLVAEMWASTLKEGIDLEEMVMVFQWIILEYCTIKQAIFLKWLSEDEKDIDYTMVRDYIMIVSRMSGYDSSDIRNCMELSFESNILEWGHLALILGNSNI